MVKQKKCYLKLCCFAFTIILVSTATTAFGAIIRVPADQPTIQAAIDAAGTGDIVLVHDGTYPVPPGGWSFDGKAITVKSEAGPANSIIDATGEPVVFTFNNGEGPDSVLSGFTITNAPVGIFAPIVCNTSSPTVTDLVMYNNDGFFGAILSVGGSPTISDCTIRNSSGAYGMIQLAGGSPTMTGCRVVDNTGQWIGGIYCFDTSATISGCIIKENTATNIPGGGDPASVGGISCTGGSPSITGCIITDNTGVTTGGIQCEGPSSSPTISGCTFFGNSGESFAGAIGFGDSSGGTVADCQIIDNVGTVGGIGSEGSVNLVITGCTIVVNEGKFGGIYSLAVPPEAGNWTVTNCIISDNYGPEAAGGITIYESDATLTNCTITGNEGQYAGGIMCYNASSVIATNCILWGNTPQPQADNCSFLVSYCDVEGGPLSMGAGCINEDPLLEDYRLTPGSPCIDAGTSEGAPNRDIDGNLRPHGGGYDMGADEYGADKDDDGVPDYLEMGPDAENPDPNFDGNDDGIPDSEQGNVFSCPTFDGGNYVTVACPDPAFFTDAGTDRHPYPDDSPPGMTFPFSFFRFNVNNVGPGGATTVTIYLTHIIIVLPPPYEQRPGGPYITYSKFGPDPQDARNTWYEFAYDGETGAVFNEDSTITLHFVDGQRGDADLNGANGMILDPGAPAIVTPVAPAGDKDDSVCFINTAGSSLGF